MKKNGPFDIDSKKSSFTPPVKQKPKTSQLFITQNYPHIQIPPHLTQEAEKKNIRMIKHTPCLEVILLSILNNGKPFSSKTSADCKKEFESRHIERVKRRDIKEYQRIFPKRVLDAQRSNVKELDILISFIII